MFRNTVGEVEKVFAAASHKKVWDHFSKAQRKNIEIWKKQSSVSNTEGIALHSIIFKVLTHVTEPKWFVSDVSKLF